MTVECCCSFFSFLPLLSLGFSGRFLIVRLSLDPSAWIATQDEFTALVVDEDQYRERNGRQPPIDPARRERERERERKERISGRAKLMIKQIKDDGKCRNGGASKKRPLTSKGTCVDPCPCRACTKGRLPWPSRTGGQS